MRVCIPTIDARGPEGLPSAHFGASPYFTFFDLETSEWEAVPSQAEDRHHGACRPLDAFEGRSVDAVLCRGLGGGAYARLTALGVRVYLTREPDIASCLEAFKGGRLPELTEADVCQGRHGHSHGGGHHPRHRHGTGQADVGFDPPQGGRGHGESRGSGHHGDHAPTASPPQPRQGSHGHGRGRHSGHR